MGVGRVGRAGLELEVVAAGDRDQGEVRGRGAGEEWGRVRLFLLGGPALAAVVPFDGGDGEQRDFLSTALRAGTFDGIGEAPAGPTAGLPAGAVVSSFR